MIESPKEPILREKIPPYFFAHSKYLQGDRYVSVSFIVAKVLRTESECLVLEAGERFLETGELVVLSQRKSVSNLHNSIKRELEIDQVVLLSPGLSGPPAIQPRPRQAGKEEQWLGTLRWLYPTAGAENKQEWVQGKLYRYSHCLVSTLVWLHEAGPKVVVRERRFTMPESKAGKPGMFTVDPVGTNEYHVIIIPTRTQSSVPSVSESVSTAKMSALSFLRSQLFITPPVPTYDFEGQTVIVTGANRGIGLEAARHLLRLNAKCVVLAVRSTKRGQDAAEELESSTGRTGIIQMEELDMASYESVKTFAARMNSLDRLDAVLLNAGMYTHKFYLADGYESQLTVNVINTFFLALLLLPTLRASAKKYNTRPRISFVSSDRHVMFKLPEWKDEKPFEVLSDPKRARMQERLVQYIPITVRT